MILSEVSAHSLYIKREEMFNLQMYTKHHDEHMDKAKCILFQNGYTKKQENYHRKNFYEKKKSKTVMNRWME